MGSIIYSKYPPWSDFGGRKVLNVGCGHAQFEAPNVMNVDAYGDPTLKWDLRNVPLPLADESFDLILANHIMEHLSHEHFWALFEDCARMLKVNGRMEIYVPGDGSDSTFGYRDHVIQINHCSFYGTYGTYRSSSNAWAVENAISPANRMKYVDRKDWLWDKWWLKGPVWWKMWCRTHLRNVVCEQGFFFRKVSEAEMAEEMTRCSDRFKTALSRGARPA